MQIVRITRWLTRAARPSLLVAGLLLAGGATLALTGAGVIGWSLYLAGYIAGLVAIPAVMASLGRRLGRLGRTGGILTLVGVVLGLPVMAMLVALHGGNIPLHDALMPYVLTPFGMLSGVITVVGLIVFGIAVVRSRALPADAGWLLVAAGGLDLTTELGILPIAGWGLSMIVVLVAFVRIAVAVPTIAQRETPAPSIA